MSSSSAAVSAPPRSTSIGTTCISGMIGCRCCERRSSDAHRAPTSGFLQSIAKTSGPVRRTLGVALYEGMHDFAPDPHPRAGTRGGDDRLATDNGAFRLGIRIPFDDLSPIAKVLWTANRRIKPRRPNRGNEYAPHAQAS